VAEEVAPVSWKPGAADWLRRTAIARYLYYRWQVRLNVMRNLLFPRADAAANSYEANVDIVAVLRHLPEITVATDYLFARLAALARANETRLLLAMDAVRDAIYAERAGRAIVLNQLADELARKHGLTFVDLDPVFRAAWKADQRRFEFESDAHWNEYAHAVAARAVARAIKEHF
jgi:hypothetical protein